MDVRELVLLPASHPLAHLAVRSVAEVAGAPLIAVGESQVGATRLVNGDWEEARARLEARPFTLTREGAIVRMDCAARVMDRGALQALHAELGPTVWVAVPHRDSLLAIGVEASAEERAQFMAAAAATDDRLFAHRDVLLVHEGRVVQVRAEVGEAPLIVSAESRSAVATTLPGVHLSREELVMIPASGPTLRMWFADGRLLASLDNGAPMPATRLVLGDRYLASELLDLLCKTDRVFVNADGTLERELSDAEVKSKARRRAVLSSEITIEAGNGFARAVRELVKTAQITRVPVTPEDVIGSLVAEDVLNPSGEVVLQPNEEVTAEALDRMRELGVSSLRVAFADLDGGLAATLVRTHASDERYGRYAFTLPTWEIADVAYFRQLFRDVWADDAWRTDVVVNDVLRMIQCFNEFRREAEEFEVKHAMYLESSIAFGDEAGTRELHEWKASRIADALDGNRERGEAALREMREPAPVTREVPVHDVTLYASGHVRDVAVTDTLVATIDHAGEVRVLTLREGREIARWRADTIGAQVEWLVDGEQLLVHGQQGLARWTLASQTREDLFPSGPALSNLALAPDRKSLAAVQRTDWIVGVWDVPASGPLAHAPRAHVPKRGGVELRGWDGQLLALSTGRVDPTTQATLPGDSRVMPQSLEERRSPDGALVWAATSDTTSVVWAGQVLAELPARYATWVDSRSLLIYGELLALVALTRP